MPDTTTRLKLLKPYGYEAFKRTDFETNWGILDNFPGVQIVPGATGRPLTDATRGGMLLYQVADRSLVASEGTSWVPLRQYAFTTYFSYTGYDSVPKNVSKYYPASPWTLTMPRAGGIVIMGTARLSQQTGLAQDVLYKPFINGLDADLTADDTSTVRFGDAGNGASGMVALMCPFFGYRGGLAKGSPVTIQVRVSTGARTNDAIMFTGIKCQVIFTDA
jgi:hypothetical protein